jgi:hypothetical protein
VKKSKGRRVRRVEGSKSERVKKVKELKSRRVEKSKSEKWKIEILLLIVEGRADDRSGEEI